MGGRGGGGRTQVSSPGAARDEARVLQAIGELDATHRESWVSLAQLRERLPGMTRERQDAALSGLFVEGRVGWVTPEREPEPPRAQQRAAAFRHAGINYYSLRATRNS